MEFSKDKLIVITGAAGFIGSNVVRKLNEKGYHHLLLVDDLKSTEKWKNLVGKSFLDLIPKSALLNWLDGEEDTVGAIIHLGACSDTTERNADYLLENNYRFSVKLADYALKNNIRFIYASSAATYGDGTLGFKDDEFELEKLLPLNMYGYSKHLFDLILKRQGALSRMVGLKFFNVFGPNEAHKGRMASAITFLVPQILNDGKIKLFRSSEPERFADGEQVRDFIWVDDVARMTIAFLDNDANGIFNIGTGTPTTWNSLAQSVFEALGKPVDIEYIDMPPSLVGQYQNYTCADTTKLRQALGNEAETTPIPLAVKEYVQKFLLPGKLW